MANSEQIKILKQGAEAWNKWREERWNKWREGNLDIENLVLRIDLSEADLSEADLSKANLRGANLRGADFYKAKFVNADLYDADLREADLRWASLFEANLCRADLREADLSNAGLTGANLINANLSGANLREADFARAHLWEAELCGADLREADLRWANFMEANLSRADLREADLSGANLFDADLSGADLDGAFLQGTSFVKTKLEGTNLSNSYVYGISAWDLKTNKDTKQLNLVITDYREEESIITVDSLEVAQFVYLLLNNEKIRDVINTIGEKGVLIFGRFTKERKAVLDAIRKKLRELGFVPMMFDFEKPTQRDFTETIKTLAGMSRFIIADITNPKSSPLELQATMPDYMIPFVPIIQEDEQPFAMFQDLQQKYREWVLDILKYDSADNLLEVLDEAVVKPALEKADQLLFKKAEGIRDRHVKEYLK